MAGRFIGRYRVVRRLGAGGMGEVFEGFDDQLQRPVAIKGLAAGVGGPAAAERLRREALACAALNHPNIAHVYEIITSAESDYLVMEYIEGRTLAEMLRVGPLPVEDVMRIGEAVARALAAAHERGIVHRDIKPENVMVTRDGHVKVLDFGVAKRVVPAPTVRPGLTMSGTVVGTSSAMSPEQALARDVDHRSDIFSLGSLLYFMAAGRPAFSGETAAEIMVRVARSEHVPLRKAVEGVPPELDSIVERCLAVAPNDRYGSALDVAEQLRRLRSTATFATRAMPTATLSRVLRSPGVFAAAVAGVAALALLAGAGLMARRPAAISVAIVPVPAGEADPTDLTSVAVFDALTSALVGRRNLHVVPVDEIEPTATAARRGVEIARAVGADELVEASVTRAPGREEARVSLVATRGKDGTIRWSDQVDVPSGSLLRLESRIEAAVALAYPDHAADTDVAPREKTEEAARLFLTAAARWRRRAEPPDDDTVERLGKSVELAPRWVEPSLALIDAEIATWSESRNPDAIERARKLVDRLAPVAARDPRVARRAVVVALARGDLELARATATEQVAAHHDSVLAWSTLAEVERRAGDWVAAEEALKHAMALRRSWLFVRGLARISAGRGDLAAAREHLAAAREMSPDNPLLLADAADLATRAGDLDQAYVAARRLVVVDPRRDSFLRAAATLMDLQRPAAAAQLLRDAVARLGDDTETLAALAGALRWAGQADAAREAAERALRVATADDRDAAPDVRVQRGRALAQAWLGHSSDAVMAAHSALALVPDDPRTLYTMALVAAINGDGTACRTWSDQASRRGAPAAWFDRPEFRALAARPVEDRATPAP